MHCKANRRSRYLGPRATLVLMRLAILLTALLLLVASAHAQQADLVSSETDTLAADPTMVLRIESAFRASDAGALLAEAADPLDLAIFGYGASYSRSQAALVLADFFRRFPPATVRFEEEVVAEDRRSVIGQYREAGATEAAAVFVRLRARDGRWEIRSIRIDRGRR